MSEDKSKLVTYGEKEVASMLGIKVATLQSWRWQRRGPAFVKIGRRVRYRQEDIAAYLDKNTVGQLEAV